MSVSNASLVYALLLRGQAVGSWTLDKPKQENNGVTNSNLEISLKMFS